MRRLLPVLLIAACAKPAAPSSPRLAAIDEALAARPRDPILLYLRAIAAPAEALPYLERMDALGWDVPLLPAELAPLAGDPRFDAIVARIAQRAPRVARSEVAYTLDEPDLIPEGITHDPARGTLYVGSLRTRKILAIGPDGAVSTFADLDDGLLAVVGLEVDEARDLLWATSWASTSHQDARPGAVSAVIAFRLADGEVARTVRFPDDGAHLPNDLEIAGDGTVYVTDSEGGAVYAIAPDAEEPEPVVAPGTLAYPNGIALAPDGTLHVAHGTGIAWIDPATGALEPVEAADGVLLGGIDGLVRDGDRLLAVQNGLGEGRLIALELDAHGRRATAVTVLENDPAALGIATTTCVVDGALYTVANAQLDTLGPDGLIPDRTLTPSRILRTPL
jgi:sugar lactone lactonase YvrE